MEIKINQEIRDYTEKIFFGLSFRQLFFSVLSCIVAVFVYFYLKSKIGLEAVSWVCVFSAFPFAMLGFVTYNGMTAEKFIWCWIKSEILIPKHLEYKPKNFYFEIINNERKK